MQEPYHIKVSLQEYYLLAKSDAWILPDYSEECLICKAPNCAQYLGFYERGAECPLTGFKVPDLPAFRFLCRGKGTRICNHKTFSLLPLMLVPYRRLTLKFMTLAVYLKLNHKLSLFNAMDAIEKQLVDFEDVADFISIAILLEWEKIMRLAFYRFIVMHEFYKSNHDQFVIMKRDLENGLIVFLKMAAEYDSQYINPSIRGPDGLALDFYKSNGGANELAFFLFGTASQHRN